MTPKTTKGLNNKPYNVDMYAYMYVFNDKLVRVKLKQEIMLEI